MIVGIIGLVLDGGRLFHLNTDLQELADASALAGAAELNNRSDAITRATDRAQNLLSNDPRWSNSTLNATGVQITTPTFYSSLNPDTITTDPLLASYIRVTTVIRETIPTFLPATAVMLGLGAPSNGQTAASAVAGTSTVLCNAQPLMLCNPYEGTSDFHATAGQLFHFKQKGSTGGFSPGDFGLLDPPGANSAGAKTIRDFLSRQSPNFCFVDNVSPRPGQLVGDVADAINIRFDLQPNGCPPGNCAMDKTPAPNVIKGIMTDPSKPQDLCQNNKYANDPWPSPPSPSNTSSTPNTAMVPGATDMTATPPTGILDIGNTMDLTAANAYWQYHHGADWPTVGGTPITRFQAYCQELGLGSDCKGTNTPPAWRAGTEPSTRQCAPAGVPTGDYKRRLISVAVVNCEANHVQGNSATNVRSNEYAVFFLSSPSPTNQPNVLNNYLGSATNGDIMGEFVEMINAGACAADPTNPFCPGLHSIVQLYR